MISFFEANPADDTTIFLAGSKMMKCEKGKVDLLFESHSKIYKSGEYIIAKGTADHQYHVYNFITGTLTSETIEVEVTSIWKHNSMTAVVGNDKKLYILEDGKEKASKSIDFDTDFKLVHSSDRFFYAVAAMKNSMGNIETSINVYDYQATLVERNLFSFWGAETFLLTNFKLVKSSDSTSIYGVLSYHGGKAPIVLKKASDTKFTQPKFRNPVISGISNYNDFQVENNTIFFGTGRKIYQTYLTEKDLPEEKEVVFKSAKEAGNLILTAMYKDQVSQLKRQAINTLEMPQEVKLSRVTVNPAAPDVVFLSKNDKDEKTSILRFNFDTQAESTVVKEVEKFDRKGYLVDIVVNKENKLNGIDNNGFYYIEVENDKMQLTDLMTFPMHSKFNMSRSRQLAYDHTRTKGYVVQDDGDSIIMVNLLKADGYLGLPGNLAGTIEVKASLDDLLIGVKQVVTKHRTEYILYKYDLETMKMIDEYNINVPVGYHVEALRLVDNKKILVVCNRRSDKDAKSGSNSDMLFILFNWHLEREFMSGDVPVGNKFGVSNVIEVLTTFQGLPIVMVSRGSTLYLFAIDNTNLIKQIDAINFSEADGPDATIDSAAFHQGVLYVVRNKNVLHRVKFTGV